jgi:hypothetical protein
MFNKGAPSNRFKGGKGDHETPSLELARIFDSPSLEVTANQRESVLRTEVIAPVILVL